MRIDTERDGDVAVITLDGELDASNYEAVIGAARTLQADGARALVVDLGGVAYMGSAGLVALHSAGLIFAGVTPPDGEAGWEALHQFTSDVSTTRFREVLKLAAVPATVDRVFSRTGMAALFEHHPDRATAVAAARG